ncbi:MAG: hypothetical protein WD770_10820 [Actinomycetota bacterium]
MGASGIARARRIGAGPAYAAVAVGVLALFAAPLVIHDYRLPVGPDVPFYIWSTRLAGEVGLSVTQFRPGFHALLLAGSGTTGLSITEVIGALSIALAVALGLAAAVLSDRGFGRDPVRSAVAGIAVGAFAARMASGFLANLLFAGLFVGALAVLLGRPRRPAPLAALLLGAAGLAHGLFLVIGAAVLGLGAAIRAVTGRGDPAGVRADLARLGTTAAGGSAIAALGFTLASLGPPLTEGERAHTRDVLVQRAGLGSLVEGAYLSRWREALRAFSLPVSVPLAAIGSASLRTNPLLDPMFGSILASWVLVTVGGVVAGFVTSQVPPGRVLNFALVLPLLSAAGIVAVARWVQGRWRGAGVALGAVLFAAVLFGPVRAWNGAHPFTGPTDLGAVEAAGAYVERLPPGTPLVFVIDHGGPRAGFELSRFVNVIRLGLAPDRQDDMHVFVGGPGDYGLRRAGANGDPEHDGIALDALARVESVLAAPHAPLVLRPFNQASWDDDAGTPVAEHVQLLRRLVPEGELTPGDPGAPVNRGLGPVALGFAALGLVVLLGAVGLAWVRALAPALGGAEAVALAPVAGAAAIVLASVLFDAIGLALGSWGGPAVATALVSGLLARGAARRAAG